MDTFVKVHDNILINMNVLGNVISSAIFNTNKQNSAEVGAMGLSELACYLPDIILNEIAESAEHIIVVDQN